MLTINGVANLYGSSARKLKCFESTQQLPLPSFGKVQVTFISSQPISDAFSSRLKSHNISVAPSQLQLPSAYEGHG